MSTYVEAPQEWRGNGPAVFLAGGITDCADWQAEACVLLGELIPHATLLNPRRARFPMDNPAAASEQIAWEFRHLHRATVVLFWFEKGPSPQPIALYELGRHAALDRPVAVGVDPGYLRRTDVFEQLAHARPDVRICQSLSQVCMEAAHIVRHL